MRRGRDSSQEHQAQPSPAAIEASLLVILRAASDALMMYTLCHTLSRHEYFPPDKD